MKADRPCEGIQGVSEPCVQLVQGDAGRGRRDAEVLYWFLQPFPVGFIQNWSGGLARRWVQPGG